MSYDLAMAQLLKNHKVMPWKNGGGITREIAIDPASATPENFSWRLSAADVSAEGPFSCFPGCDRLLTLVDDKELVLLWEEGKQQTLVMGRVLRFSGDDKILAQVPDGGLRDLGFSYKRDLYSAEMHLLTMESKPRSFSFLAIEIFVVALEGSATLETLPDGKLYKLNEGDALRLTPAGREGLLTIEGGGCRLAVVELQEKSP